MKHLTSHNSPLTIASVSVENGGCIGMTICPGKHQPHALSGSFLRDLSMDLDLVKSWGAAAVVTLMSQEELVNLKVDDLGAEVEGRGMLWFQLPMPHGMPDEGFELYWVYAGVRLRGLLKDGEKVLVHCGSGLGRTGLIAARLLIEIGTPIEQSLAMIRDARPGTLQNPAHEKYLQGCRMATNDDWLDRLLGCLLGGAVGDAFGYAVEFDSLAQIRQRFGRQGLVEPVLQKGKLVVSDDTQMTLFTLEGLLRSTSPTGELVQSTCLDQIRNAYLDWYDTQLGDQQVTAALHGYLAARPSLRVRRAPGNTCLSALKAGARGSIENRINQSKGCGGVMRTAPLGFLEGVDLFDLGARAAALTHGHVEGWAPAGILPRIISRLLQGEEKFIAVRNSYSDASEWGHVYGEAAGVQAYLLATKLARKMRFNPERAITHLGQGWVGDEALAIAMYAFLSARSFQDAIRRATNHDGDSDSTASIAGQLWGARHGLKDIPNAWIRRLDVLDEILLLVKGMQGWRRSVDNTSSVTRGLSNSVLHCIRMLEMTHELHVLGYQRIRIFPYMAPSGCHWRIEWAPASAFRLATDPPHVRSEREIVRYTSGNGWAPFGWQGVTDLPVQAMAQQFVRQFPELARAGEGDDWLYAGWLTRLLGEARKGRLPYMLADWSIDFSRGIPMTEGEPFPLPPDVIWKEILDEHECNANPEDDDSFEEVGRQEPDSVLKPAAGSGGEYPEPSHYDFSDLYGRTHGLVMLYHHGVPYLLQVTQLIWELLPTPKAEAATQLCALAGVDGKGKLGVHTLLERYLEAADTACEVAAGDTDRDWNSENGAVDWSKIQHTFDLMDQALLECAFQLSQKIERIVNAG